MTTLDAAGRPMAVEIDASSPAEKDAQVDAIAQTATVLSVEPDQEVRALAGIDDPVYRASPGPQWGVDRVHAPDAWGTGVLQQAAGVVVAVVDTGVYGNHEDLNGNVLAGTDFLGGSWDGRVDPNGHGTHVAGIIAELDNTIGGIGVAPQANILPVRVLDSTGSGSLTNVINGITWAADHGARIINLSLGTASPSTGMLSALQYAVAHGATVVAAAGNGGCSGTPTYPGAYSPQVSGLLAVAAVDRGDVHASFSNVASYVNIAAPGVSIASTIPTSPYYATKSGTSMAAPFVSGVAALVAAKCGGISPSQLQAILQSTADDVGAPGRDNTFGYGVVRADRAVASPCS